MAKAMNRDFTEKITVIQTYRKMLKTLVPEAIDIKNSSGRFVVFKLTKQKFNLILSKYCVGQMIIHHA